MLHWYRLVEEMLRSRSSSRPAGSGIVPHRRGLPEADEASQRLFGEDRAYEARVKIPDSSPIASLSRQEREKLFWLGLVEAAPLFAGTVFSTYTDSAAHAVLAVAVALLLTSIICWCLRHQVPLTRIELTDANLDQDHASPEVTP